MLLFILLLLFSVEIFSTWSYIGMYSVKGSLRMYSVNAPFEPRNGADEQTTRGRLGETNESQRDA